MECQIAKNTGKQKRENMYFGQNMTKMILHLALKKKKSKKWVEKRILSDCDIFGADDLFPPPQMVMVSPTSELGEEFILYPP